MKVYVPWGIIAIFISFYFFYELKRVKESKRDERREELQNRRQELLDSVIKSKKKVSGKDTEAKTNNEETGV